LTAKKYDALSIHPSIHSTIHPYRHLFIHSFGPPLIYIHSSIYQRSKLSTYNYIYVPILWVRSIACISAAGFHQGSIRNIRDATYDDDDDDNNNNNKDNDLDNRDMMMN
jgi:hypothetical protein